MNNFLAIPQILITCGLEGDRIGVVYPKKGKKEKMKMNELEREILLGQAWMYCYLYFESKLKVYAELYQELWRQLQ